MKGKAEGVDRAGAVTGGGADRVRQRRGEEDSAQVRVRVEDGAAGEFRAGEGGEESEDAARVRVSGVQGCEAGEKSPLPIRRGGESYIGIM